MITIGDLIVDAAITEEHAYEADVTRYPVEDGSDISDNVRNQPVRLTIEGLISDTPLGRAAIVRDIEIEGVDGASASTDQSLPSSAALDVLLSIRDQREPVSITTSLKLYDNMVLTSLNLPRDAETGGALKFTAMFEQITIVQNKRVRVRTTPAGARRRSKGTQLSRGLPETVSYWCVEDRLVFIKPERLNEARRMQSINTPEIWSDWRQYPNAQYTQPLLICVKKRRIRVTPEGGGRLEYIGDDGKPNVLLPNQLAALQLDAQKRAAVTNLADPIDVHTGRPLSQTPRVIPNGGVKPAWYGAAPQLDLGGPTSGAAEREDPRAGLVGSGIFTFTGIL